MIIAPGKRSDARGYYHAARFGAPEGRTPVWFDQEGFRATVAGAGEGKEVVVDCPVQPARQKDYTTPSIAPFGIVNPVCLISFHLVVSPFLLV